LQTIFQLIDLYDWLEFEPNGHQNICLDGLSSVEQTDNLIFKAAEKLKPFAQRFCGLNIHLDKHIPMGAGLGGGSSNAATTLLVLNQLWQCSLNIQQLAEIGQSLGADVPVFVYGHNAWAEGIGEQITFINLPKNSSLCLNLIVLSALNCFFHKKH
jgi:4-diphosphocytidyl-2-C-methyl-D-erythritol kinase